MKRRQLLGIAERKLRNSIVPRLPIDIDRRYQRRIPDQLDPQFAQVAANNETVRSSIPESLQRRYRHRACKAANGNLTFLNRTIRFGRTRSIEWDDERFEALPRLWRLKLYAFEPLPWLVRGFSPDETKGDALMRTFDRWLNDWIQNSEIGTSDYLRGQWTPYSVSLRILNWIRYLAWKESKRDGTVDGTEDEFTHQLTREIYKNALFLQNHVERGVGGNHLAENAVALVAAGLVFEQRTWMQNGLRLLETVGREQFLPDGGHFERSPMYHVQVIVGYLTVCDLLERHDISLPSRVRDATRSGIRFLQFIRPPDGRIPLLNDAVYDQTLSLEACLNYAEKLGITPSDSVEAAAEDSGYIWISGFGKMLVDGGPVGPPHLPGHSHNDLLQFLLWLDGDRVVTDTGVFDYEAGEKRRYARGVRGHNTVQVGSDEPIDIQGRYLMGPRTKPEVRRERSSDVELFEGEYRTYSSKTQAYRHHRAIHRGPRWWLIQDRMRGTRGREVCSRVHLHPKVDVSEGSHGEIALENHDSGSRYASIHPGPNTGICTTDGWYFPRFGENCSRTVLEYRPDNNEGARLGYLIIAPDVDGAAVEMETKDGSVSRIAIEGMQFDLPETQLS